tara:strand:+ start:2146 stop:2289 length:144 start_codon:yes stop_codon:yes gene_type:complete
MKLKGDAVNNSKSQTLQQAPKRHLDAPTLANLFVIRAGIEQTLTGNN